MEEKPDSLPVTLDEVVEKLDALCEKMNAMAGCYGKSLAVPRLLTIEETAEMLGVTVRSVQTLISRGCLNYINVSANASVRRPAKRISGDDLFAFIEARRVRKPEVDRYMRRRRRRGLA